MRIGFTLVTVSVLVPELLIAVLITPADLGTPGIISLKLVNLAVLLHHLPAAAPTNAQLAGIICLTITAGVWQMEEVAVRLQAGVFQFVQALKIGTVPAALVPRHHHLFHQHHRRRHLQLHPTLPLARLQAGVQMDIIIWDKTTPLKATAWVIATQPS